MGRAGRRGEHLHAEERRPSKHTEPTPTLKEVIQKLEVVRVLVVEPRAHVVERLAQPHERPVRRVRAEPVVVDRDAIVEILDLVVPSGWHEKQLTFLLYHLDDGHGWRARGDGHLAQPTR